MTYTLYQDLDELNPFEIELGPVVDVEEDSYLASFYSPDTEFITFETASMTLKVDPQTPQGRYHTNIMLSDFNKEQPLTSEYRINIILLDEKEETEVELASLMIDSIDRFGVVTCKFSKDIIPQTNYTLINETVI